MGTHEEVLEQQKSALEGTVQHLKERLEGFEKAAKEADEHAMGMVKEHQQQIAQVMEDAEAKRQAEVAAIKAEYTSLLETERSASEARAEASRLQHETDLASMKMDAMQRHDQMLESATSNTAKHVEDLKSALDHARNRQKSAEDALSSAENIDTSIRSLRATSPRRMTTH